MRIRLSELRRIIRQEVRYIHPLSDPGTRYTDERPSEYDDPGYEDVPRRPPTFTEDPYYGGYRGSGRMVKCVSCMGRGTIEKYTCRECGGTGEIED